MKRIYQENLLRGILNQTMDAFIVTDKSNIVLEWNQNATTLFGWTEEEAVGKRINELIVPDSFQRFHSQSHEKTLAEYQDKQSHPVLNRRIEVPAKRKDGTTFPIELTVTPVEVEGELYFGAAIRDLSSKKRDLDELERRARLINLSRDAIYVINADHKVSLWNKGAEDLYGYNAEEAMGEISYRMLRTDFSKGNQGKDFIDIIRDLMQTRSWEGELYQQRKGGEEVIVLSRWSLDIDRHEVLVTNTDITDLKKNQHRAEYLATHDELTGLPNRRLLEDRLEHAILHAGRAHEKFAVMLLDLDRFKYINDSLGHDKGDILLKEVAARVKKCIREQDTVARLGGDEFVVVLEDVQDTASIGEVANKIIKLIAQPFMLETHEMRVNSSIGIAVFPHDGTDIPTLTRNADMSMYKAKDSETGSYMFYSTEMNDAVQQRLRNEHSLRRALDNNEFLLHYQPKICASPDHPTDKMMIGVEALIRWNHPERGMVPPSEFICLAEEIGIINEIGEWALREACTQNKLWQLTGKPPIKISVNLSVHQLDNKIVKTVERVLKETGLDPQYLDLEITESAAMKNVDTTIVTLKAIRDLGVSLSIDDFGTGYSSLAHLKRMPLNYLKIDQSFIRGILHDKNDVTIVKSIIVMAHSMGLKVIAEGVDDAEQVAFLDTMQCDEMQGFLFSKPLESGKLEQTMMIHTWSKPYLSPEDQFILTLEKSKYCHS